MTVGIAYVDGPRLARSLYAAADWVAAGRDEINRINVFPVPDGDTGTNLSLTLRTVADALRAVGDASLSETARTAARGAMLGARGNSGMMLTYFLLGFADAIDGREQISAQEVARGIHEGAERLYSSLDDPREGYHPHRGPQSGTRRGTRRQRLTRHLRLHGPDVGRGRALPGPDTGTDGGPQAGGSGQHHGKTDSPVVTNDIPYHVQAHQIFVKLRFLHQLERVHNIVFGQGHKIVTLWTPGGPRQGIPRVYRIPESDFSIRQN